MDFHNAIHGFSAGRLTRIAIVELKLAQVLECVDKYTIFLVFLILRKSYENLDQGWLLKTF